MVLIRWRKMRKASHEALLSKTAVEGHRGIQTQEACLFVTHLLESPQAWMGHNRRYSSPLLIQNTSDLCFHRSRTSTSTTMTLIFNTPPLKNEHDPRMLAIIDHGERLSRAILHLFEVCAGVVPRSRVEAAGVGGV